MCKWISICFFFATCLTAQKPESLLIGPGDLLHIEVFDTPALEQRVRVTDAGELPLILGGQVKVATLTPAQAAHAIEVKLQEDHLLLHPRVAVAVEEYATQKVSVLGEVKLPGAYAIATSRSVLDVLTLAGGLTDLADRKILIERHGSNEKTTYFVSNQAAAALDTAVRINPGDTVVVPKAGIVYVLGDVARPGGYAITNNDSQLSALQLIAKAAGTNHTAVPSHARLIRKTADGYTNTALALSSMQKGKTPDLLLQTDDIVYVPFSYMRNFGSNATGIAASVGSAAIYRF